MRQSGVWRLVADAFGGDQAKTETWFRAANPMLGNVSPAEMVLAGQTDRLRAFLIDALAERSLLPRKILG